MNRMRKPSMFEFAGGEPAFLALAAALHERCLADPELNHPFSNAGPKHTENLAAYWVEVFGGPARYSKTLGGQSGMLGLHAGHGTEDELGRRFADCFMAAVDDAHMPDDPEFRTALRKYIDSAVTEVMSVSPAGSRVLSDLTVPRWSWGGPV